MGDPKSEFLALLECPICFETSKPPITVCSNGHNICPECKGKISKCPLCKGTLTNTRNWYAEKSYEILTSKNASTALPKDVDKHKILSSKEEALLKIKRPNATGSTKLFRSQSSIVGAGSGTSQIACNMMTSKLQCTHKMIPSFSLRRHWETDHGMVQRANGSVSNVTIKDFGDVAELNRNGFCEPFTLTFSGKLFVVMRTFRQEGIYFWVNMNGNENDSARFTAQIKLEDDKQTAISAWKGPVKSALEGNGNEENALFLSWRTIRQKAHYDVHRQAWSLQQRVEVQNRGRSARVEFSNFF